MSTLNVRIDAHADYAIANYSALSVGTQSGRRQAPAHRRQAPAHRKRCFEAMLL